MDFIALLMAFAALAYALRLREKIHFLQDRVSDLEEGRRDSAIERRFAEMAATQEPARPEPVVVPVPEPARPFVAPPPPIAVEVPEPEPAFTVRPVRTVPEQPSPEPAAYKRGLSFEDVFGRYLPIWAGGVTLVVAGVLIVKYSIDAGLLSPMVRVIAGLIFGTALIAGGEAARGRLRDVRISQSLAGAGCATLYAAILVAANLYHLIDPMTAFVGLAAVTGLAAGLSLRFGAPSAVLGLVGGIAAPALVGAESPNIPLLATYLALTIGGLSVLGRAQRWWWLGALAILGGFGWGTLLIVTSVLDTATALSLGLLTLLLAVGFPLLLAGDESRWVRVAAALAGCVQMAALVAIGGHDGLDWALFGLVATAIAFLSRRQKLFADAPLMSATVGLVLVFAWPNPWGWMLAAVLAGGAAIHGGPALARLWRADGRLGDAVLVTMSALAIALVPLFHFDGRVSPSLLATLAMLGAALAGGAAARGWRHAERDDDARFAMLALTGIALVLLAAALVIEPWAVAPVVAAGAGAALLLARRAQDARIELGAQLLAALGLLFVLAPPGEFALMHATGMTANVDPLITMIRWLVPAAVAAGFARWSSMIVPRGIGAGAATGLAFVALAQLLPVNLIALLPAAMLVALAFAPRRDELAPALGVTAALALGWAALPLAQWLAMGATALGGTPMYVQYLPWPSEALIRIGAPAAALFVLLWRGALHDRIRAIATLNAAALAVIAAHIVWKQSFAIQDSAAFIALGMGERTLWELLLLGAALLAWGVQWRRTACALSLAGLVHFAWFTGLLHNPLWTLQAAGIWLVPAYAIGAASLWLAVRSGGMQPVAVRAQQWGRMALILLLAASLLRQIFHGSMLSVGAVTGAEDIARSLVAILLALGFLWHGIARTDKDWRIASLALMLGAVGKVFLFDAAGLDGLQRIGSFIALGLSLILVGWVYSRYLPDARLTPAQDDAPTSQDDTGGMHVRT